MALIDFIQQSQQRVNAHLDACAPIVAHAESQLGEAMRYSLLNGGKRIRPILVYATADALGCPPEQCDNAASAVEIIHAYSLIHDDLPAMDDDDLRRGKPTCHIAFDEATAILAGDALQALAFEILTQSDDHLSDKNRISDKNKVAMVQRLASASGIKGMAAGQAIDLASVAKSLTLEQLERMHQLKTGALISASVILGALACNCADNSRLNALESYAAHIGLAFQIKDDILDVESDTDTLGKPQGADHALNKPTYTSILGLEQAREHAQLHQRQAVSALDIFGAEADNLRLLSAYIIERNK